VPKYQSDDHHGGAPQGGTDWTRRRFLGRAATVAWMTPAILTVAASRASAQVGSCAHTGEDCSVLPCCPGCTCGITAPFCQGSC
jgi:hypothetical protein